VAIAVVRQAIKEGLNRIEITDAKKAVEDNIWVVIFNSRVVRFSRETSK